MDHVRRKLEEIEEKLGIINREYEILKTIAKEFYESNRTGTGHNNNNSHAEGHRANQDGYFGNENLSERDGNKICDQGGVPNIPGGSRVSRIHCPSILGQLGIRTDFQMTLDELVKKYLGKPVDFDGYYGPQCVDWFRQYVRDVLETAQPRGVVGAQDFWSNYEGDSALNQVFTKISNAATNSPKKGDVVIWKGKQYGHIAIATGEGNSNTFKSWDQNYNGVQKVQLVEHNYTNVLGWLRPKKMTEEDKYRVLYQDLLVRYTDLRSRWDKRDIEFDQMNETIEKLTKENEALREELGTKLTEFEQAVKDLRANNAEWKKKCEDLADLNIKLMEETKLLNAIKNAVASLFKK